MRGVGSEEGVWGVRGGSVGSEEGVWGVRRECGECEEGVVVTPIL